VDDDTICTFAKGIMMALAYPMREMDVEDTEDHTREEIEAKVIAVLKDYLVLKNPEYNLDAGFAKLKDNEEVAAMCAGAVFAVLGAKGYLEDD
jgi:hypothetical protein